MSNVVKKRRGSDDCLLVLTNRDRILCLAKKREGATRQVVRPQCVLESRMGRARVDEVRPAQLPDVAEPLKDFGIDETERELVDSDVVPDRVAQNLEAHAPFIAVGSR